MFRISSMKTDKNSRKNKLHDMWAIHLIHVITSVRLKTFVNSIYQNFFFSKFNNSVFIIQIHIDTHTLKFIINTCDSITDHVSSNQFRMWILEYEINLADYQQSNNHDWRATKKKPFKNDKFMLESCLDPICLNIY